MDHGGTQYLLSNILPPKLAFLYKIDIDFKNFA